MPLTNFNGYFFLIRLIFKIFANDYFSYKINRMKIFLLLPLIATGVFCRAQSVGNSPYGAFGLGDVKYDNSLDISSMGGISTAYINDFSNKFNYRNPAANANLDLTTFSIEATNENNFYKSRFAHVNSIKHSTYMSNISLAFPLSEKVKFGMGYQPYSAKGYDILRESKQGDGTKQINHFVGTGQVSTIQGALSLKVSDKFSLGYRTNFYFGKISDLEEIAISDVHLINGIKTTNKVLSFNHTFGTAFQANLSGGKKLTLGATYTLSGTKNIKTAYTNSTYYYNGTDIMNESVIDIRYNTGKNLIPTEASFGVGLGSDGKWFVSTQLDYKEKLKVQHKNQSFDFQDSYRLAVGGWYLPNYNNFRNYFSRVIYRWGAYYEKGHLKLKPSGAKYPLSVDKFALTAGMVLPFANTSINKLNSIDVGLEIGKRGTLRNNLINQTFVNLRIGFTFADKWFQKQTYN